MRNPKVTVTMLSYNTANYIGDAIASVLDQTFDDFELLIIDDCSSDDTSSLLTNITDPRVSIVRNERNRGIAYCRNLALDLSTGDYIAILDSDDIAPPYRLQDQYDYMEENPDVDILSGEVEGFGKYTYKHVPPTGHTEILYSFLFRNYIANPAVMMRRSTIRSNGTRYDSGFYVCSDLHFWMDSIPDVTFGNLIGRPYVRYRNGHQESVTTDSLMQRDRTCSRDRIVNLGRRKLLDKLGLKLTDDAFDILCQAYGYERITLSDEERRRLDTVHESLLEQGRQAGLDQTVWSTVLEKFRIKS